MNHTSLVQEDEPKAPLKLEPVDLKIDDEKPKPEEKKDDKHDEKDQEKHEDKQETKPEEPKGLSEIELHK